MAEKEIEKKGTSEISLSDGQMAVFSSSGFEGTTSDTFMIPLLRVLNALSPARKKSDPTYIPEAEDGDFYNSATGELKKEMNVRVLRIDHQICCWVPRSQGGGFRGAFHKSEEGTIVVRKNGLEKWDKDDNEVVDTIMLTCMDADDPRKVFFIPMAKTAFKHGKTWVSRMSYIKINPETFELDQENGKEGAATWAVVWNIKTVLLNNAKGEWYAIGNTPKAVRTFTQDDLPAIQSALNMIKDAELNYSELSEEQHSEAVTDDEGDTTF